MQQRCDCQNTTGRNQNQSTISQPATKPNTKTRCQKLRNPETTLSRIFPQSAHRAKRETKCHTNTKTRCQKLRNPETTLSRIFPQSAHRAKRETKCHKETGAKTQLFHTHPQSADPPPSQTQKRYAETLEIPTQNNYLQICVWSGKR